MSQPPFFHEATDAVRFWVLIDGALIGASVPRTTLQIRFKPPTSSDDPVVIYHRHAADLDAAVRRRVAAGSIEPVMLREYDLRPGAV
jgi:hypothetical protein